MIKGLCYELTLKILSKNLLYFLFRYQFTSLLSSSNSLNDFIDNDLNQCAIENNLGIFSGPYYKQIIEKLLFCSNVFKGEIKMRFQNNRNEYSKSSPNHLDSHIISAETDDNLKWIEENISTTLVDRFGYHFKTIMS